MRYAPDVFTSESFVAQPKGTDSSSQPTLPASNPRLAPCGGDGGTYTGGDGGIEGGDGSRGGNGDDGGGDGGGGDGGGGEGGGDGGGCGGAGGDGGGTTSWHAK
jgi:hypothetical protein